MIRRRRLIYNTALLTVSSLLMSCIGMAFQVWLVGRIGSAGIGLYQLVLSVTNLLATFAISGIRFASTRLVSEELGLENPGGIRSAMRRCLGYASFFGAAAGAGVGLVGHFQRVQRAGHIFPQTEHAPVQVFPAGSRREHGIAVFAGRAVQAAQVFVKSQRSVGIICTGNSVNKV